MRTILLSVFLTIIPLSVYAECNLKTDITENADGSFTYSSECHLLMGQWKKDLEARTKQVAELERTIELKDLAYNAQQERLNLWRDTSFELEDRVLSIERWQTTNKWIHFGLGVAVTVLSVYAAGQLQR